MERLGKGHQEAPGEGGYCYRRDSGADLGFVEFDTQGCWSLGLGAQVTQTTEYSDTPTTLLPAFLGKARLFSIR